MRAYQESKLYNIMFTFLLAEKMQGTDVSVNCLHPGYVKTRLPKFKGRQVTLQDIRKTIEENDQFQTIEQVVDYIRKNPNG